jgi:hypothetical protein
MGTLNSHNNNKIDSVFISILKYFVIYLFFFVHFIPVLNTKKQIRQLILNRTMKF